MRPEADTAIPGFISKGIAGMWHEWYLLAIHRSRDGQSQELLSCRYLGQRSAAVVTVEQQQIESTAGERVILG